MKIVFEADQHRAAAYDGDKEIGECTYSDGEKIWIIDHTFTGPTYRGQGIAAELVSAVVEAAWEKGRKIMPLCPYAAKEFARKPAYHDIWHGH